MISNLDKDSADRLSKTVDEACMLLADYNGRLAAELEDRKQLARMLADFIRSQNEILTEKEHKLEVRKFFYLTFFILKPSTFLECWGKYLNSIAFFASIVDVINYP